MESTKVAVVGGGLVGTLNTCFLAKRGFKVDLYEYRDDIRTMEHVTGKSINLSLSLRGRTALRAVGLEEKVVQKHGIPMYGRMIHGTDGSLRPIYYGKKDEYILSVGRRHLNELLLTEAEKFSNVNIHFNHKLIKADLEQGKAVFRRGPTNEEITVESNLIVGCDGAFSQLRREMTKIPGFNFSQTYIEHGYMELCIPPTVYGQFAMEMNYLHIWPRGTFMLIALPNQDKSWTVTLFMPMKKFKSLFSVSVLIEFFELNFSDVVPLIGRERLINDFFSLTPSHLVSVKCYPYNFGSKALIMGDAAHAMVPFYGQGMNAGFEDCLILNELLQKYNDDFTKALPEFSFYRNPDAEAICDLAMYNYIEMRDLVNSRLFLLRKKIDSLLYLLFRENWIPLYTMVSFTRTRYHEVVKKRRKQDKVLKCFAVGLGSIATVGLMSIVYKFRGSLSFYPNVMGKKAMFHFGF